MFQRFWDWYARHERLATGITAFLFAWQLLHLLWLTLFVVAGRLLGDPIWILSGIWEKLIVIVDYTEIPALISAKILYVNDLRTKRSFKSVLYLVLVNSQWLHLFWITDEFVLDAFFGRQTVTILPFYLAWVAIGIDYLELPVIYDTIKRSFAGLAGAAKNNTNL